ncbi:MAG: hypothetical protein ACKD6N_00365 [Candidatus Bathyarchaeota archaeon]
MLVKRYERNPILKPKSIHSWEAQAVFNGCPVKVDGKIRLVYRAISLPHYKREADKVLAISNIGITAPSKNGVDFHDRRILIAPEEPWEKFGCEDPRITKLDGKYFIFYTALSTYPPSHEGIRVGLAISDDLETIRERHLVTPFNAKAMTLFPERIDGKIWAILSVHTDIPPTSICITSFDNEEEIWDEIYWKKFHENFDKYCLPLRRSPLDHFEVGAPPLKTKYGWLLLYSYIQGYFTPNRLFTVEAALLDLNNPLKLIARTRWPLMTPEEYYERVGLVPNAIFPSGALLRGNQIYLYYGAADTVCCLAYIHLPSLIKKLLWKAEPPKFIRATRNPIITPRGNHSWEAKATFNPAAIYLGGKVHIVYRAMSQDNTSVLGYAYSKDGINIDYRSPEPIYVPRESFEQKLVPGGNSGCEDPRLTVIGDRIYMCYTAFNGKDPPRVALTWIKVDDFLQQKWNWAKPVLISAPYMDDKDAYIFPEKVKDPGTGEEKYLIVHRYSNDIDSALVSSLDFDGKTWLDEYRWIYPRKGWWDSVKVGAASPPIKTDEGWILLYHGVSEDRVYRVGAVLLDPKNPLKIIARTDEPIFEPETDYEKVGQVNNVVFPCGTVVIGDEIFMYYGGADQVVGVATIKVKKLLRYLKSCKI